MKRTLLILLALILSISTVGCAGQAGDQVRYEIFTDEFFADVVEIRDSSSGVVSGEQMEPVIQYLKGLTLTPTDEHLRTTDEKGDQLYGSDLITFRKSDGTELTVLRNAAKMTGLDACSYVAEGENLNAGLKEAFDQALKHRGE